MYNIYILDYDGSYIELDKANETDITFIYSTSDYTDIEKREDVKTTEITFLDTDRNRYAFGNIFHLNSFVNTSLPNKTMFNYSGSRKVDCLVYEDGDLIINGTLLLIDITLNNRVISYKGMITGKTADFFKFIKDRKLTDLNLSKYRHVYSQWNITPSWGATPGYGYIYPYQDLGSQISITQSNIFSLNHNIQNFVPSMYCYSILESIVSQALSATGSTVNGGYTFEILGTQSFQDEFKRLYLDAGVEKLNAVYSGGGSFSITPGHSASVTQQMKDTDGVLWGVNSGYNNPIVFTQSTFYLLGASTTFNGPHVGGGVSGYTFPYFMRNTSIDGQVNIPYTIKNNSSYPMTFTLDVVTRDYIANDTNPSNGWSVIASDVRLINASSTQTGVFDFVIPMNEFKQYQQIAVRTRISDAPNGQFWMPTTAQITLGNSWKIKFPRTGSNSFSYDVIHEDEVVPYLPKDMTQFDFVKSLMNMFNLYVYTDRYSPKHLIFQTYDDFYGLCSPENLIKSALNWTNKIDHSTIKQISNIQTPKSYLWTYKEDSDFINESYKKVHNKVYGEKIVLNSGGHIDQKKIELPYSPTPETQYSAADRLFPSIYKDSGLNRSRTEYNPRILHYNGQRSTGANYFICSDSFDKSTGAVGFTTSYWSPFTGYTHSIFNTYGYVSEFYAPGPSFSRLRSLSFGRPDEYYYGTTNSASDFMNVPTLYDRYYSNQILEMVDPNLNIYECKANLSKLDRAELDLRKPVYIDFGKYGNTYFKVLKVSYSGKEILSKLTLQEINYVHESSVPYVAPNPCSTAIISATISYFEPQTFPLPDIYHITITSTSGEVPVSYLYGSSLSPEHLYHTSYSDTFEISVYTNPFYLKIFPVCQNGVKGTPLNMTLNLTGGSIGIVYTSTTQSSIYYKQGCDESTHYGSAHIYSVPYGSFTSSVSQQDANDLAIAYMDIEGQNFANSLGSCIPKCSPPIGSSIVSLTGSVVSLETTISTIPAPCGYSWEIKDGSYIASSGINTTYYYNGNGQRAISITASGLTQGTTYTLGVSSNCCDLGLTSSSIYKIFTPGDCVGMGYTFSEFTPAIVGTTYSFIYPLTGDAPFDYSVSSKPSWMGITLSGNNLVFSGVPTQSSDVELVYIFLSNCAGNTNINISQYITVYDNLNSSITNLRTTGYPMSTLFLTIYSHSDILNQFNLGWLPEGDTLYFGLTQSYHNVSEVRINQLGEPFTSLDFGELLTDGGSTNVGGSYNPVYNSISISQFGTFSIIGGMTVSIYR